MSSLETTLLLGAYMFGAGGYIYTWNAWKSLHELVTNHQAHRFEALEKRVQHLEDGPRAR